MDENSVYVVSLVDDTLYFESCWMIDTSVYMYSCWRITSQSKQPCGRCLSSCSLATDLTRCINSLADKTSAHAVRLNMMHHFTVWLPDDPRPVILVGAACNHADG
jgi:hypothetical protein